MPLTDRPRSWPQGRRPHSSPPRASVARGRIVGLRGVSSCQHHDEALPPPPPPPRPPIDPPLPATLVVSRFGLPQNPRRDRLLPRHPLNHPLGTRLNDVSRPQFLDPGGHFARLWHR